MAKSFIRIINELADVSLYNEKENLSIEAGKALALKPGQADAIIVPLIETLKRSPELTNFQKITESDFYELEIRPYSDTDGSLRVSIQISFLQDFDESEDDLTEKVAVFIFGELLKKNLDILVNDICINDVQYKNGSLR